MQTDNPKLYNTSCSWTW